MNQDDREDGIEKLNEDTAPKDTPDTTVNPETEEPTQSDTFGGEKNQDNTSAAKSTEATPPTERPPTIDVEVEPATVAPPEVPTSPDLQSSEQSSELNSPEKAPESGAKPVTLSALNVSALATKDKKRLLMILAACLLLFGVVGVLTWWMLASSGSSNSETEKTSSQPIEQPKLGVAFTVTDGTVEYSVDDSQWEAASETTELKEGDSVRTGGDGRAVLTLDDGSAARLDADTTVKLASLAADDVRIEQEQGAVYSRVVPSERSYTVAVDDTTYEALGTAFVTVKSETENGVQVYQSSVKTSDSEDEVGEGEQFYKKSSDTELQDKVTVIDIDSLVDNAFVNWNLAQDESDTKFKERLGILSQVKERAEELRLEQEAAEKARLEAERKAEAERQAKKKEEAERDSNLVTRGTMVLDRSGNTFSWSYTGKAIHGYKLVYSKNGTPTFGADSSIYYSSMSQTSAEFPKKSKIGGGRYYVRVCAYTANTEDEPCVDYSNVGVINL